MRRTLLLLTLAACGGSEFTDALTNDASSDSPVALTHDAAPEDAATERDAALTDAGLDTSLHDASPPPSDAGPPDVFDGCSPLPPPWTCYTDAGTVFIVPPRWCNVPSAGPPYSMPADAIRCREKYVCTTNGFGNGCGSVTNTHCDESQGGPRVWCL